MLRRLAFGVFLLLTALSVIFALRDDKTVTTKSSEAYMRYLAGVDLREKYYFRQSAKEFEQAVALDSGFMWRKRNWQSIPDVRLQAETEGCGNSQRPISRRFQNENSCLICGPPKGNSPAFAEPRTKHTTKYPTNARLYQFSWPGIG
jgi:hypothetical protein